MGENWKLHRITADSGAPARVAARLGVWFTVVGFGLALYWIAVALSLFTPLAFLAYIGTIIGMSALAKEDIRVKCSHICRLADSWRSMLWSLPGAVIWSPSCRSACAV